jgi:hypothetical protein
MSDVENARARAEAVNEPAGRALRSARRAQLWAGLNRYLASEAAHASRAEPAERADQREDGDEESPPDDEERYRPRPGATPEGGGHP